MGGGGCRECPNPCGNFQFDDEDLPKSKQPKLIGGLSLVAVPCIPRYQVRPELLHIYREIECKIDNTGKVSLLRFQMSELTSKFAETISLFLTESGKNSLSGFRAIAEREGIK